MRDGSRADYLKTLTAELPATNAKTKTTNNRFNECVRPVQWDGGGPYAWGFYLFFNERTCATTALTSSSESLALNEGMYLPLPFLTVSLI